LDEPSGKLVMENPVFVANLSRKYNLALKGPFMFKRAAFAFALIAFIAVSVYSQTTTLRVIPPPADVAAAPADAAKTASGLASKQIEPGTGTMHPSKTDLVTVDYTGWTTDGKMFDSSVSKGKAACFPLDRVILGWTEGVQLMVDGEKRRFWIPESLAYQGKRDPKGTLVFDVKLLSFTEVPKSPTDVKAAPGDSKKTSSGLAYKMLKEGVGGRHPKPSDKVTVHYSGWTTDGKMFDSSVVRCAPTSFQLDGVIPGWTEGVQLMVEGEKMRFWIPQQLAYKGQSPPYGMLVFDVELIKIN
jgi:FKBP-type peptidyl-prolyl cis-trans isomerase